MAVTLVVVLCVWGRKGVLSVWVLRDGVLRDGVLCVWSNVCVAQKCIFVYVYVFVCMLRVFMCVYLCSVCDCALRGSYMWVNVLCVHVCSCRTDEVCVCVCLVVCVLAFGRGCVSIPVRICGCGCVDVCAFVCLCASICGFVCVFRCGCVCVLFCAVLCVHSRRIGVACVCVVCVHLCVGVSVCAWRECVCLLWREGMNCVCVCWGSMCVLNDCVCGVCGDDVADICVVLVLWNVVCFGADVFFFGVCVC